MATSDALRETFAAGRPLVEQWLDIAEKMAALRDAATAKGLDWSQLKALMKAQIQDERDDTGEGKRVRRIVEKAEFASAYADMLGLVNMNENNFSPTQSYAEAKGRARELTDTQEQPETNDEGSRPESQVGRDSAPDASEHGAAARPIHQDHDADRNGLVCGSGPTGDEAGTAVAHSPSPETPQATADEEAAPPAASSAPNPNPQPTSSPGADEAGGVPTPPSPASQFDNPRCKSPDGCTFAHSRNSCFDCTMAWATRPRDEQRKLWQDAVAASETESA